MILFIFKSINLHKNLTNSVKKYFLQRLTKIIFIINFCIKSNSFLVNIFSLIAITYIVENILNF
jgi:hypothetical protein